MKKVLITGGAGYIGSALSRQLLAAGYKVRVLDKFLFGFDSVADILGHEGFEVMTGDVLNYQDLKRAVSGVDSVVHLASLVGDPVCAAEPDTATEINYVSTARLGRLCREKKIKRFLFASTCSVYGASDGELITEESELNPVSLYAETKIDSEKALLGLAQKDFKPTIMRVGTVYGFSPRMRFDLVVNFFTWKAFSSKRIKIFNGELWRPFLHVDDACGLVLALLEAPVEEVGEQTFNVGFTKENFKLKQLGELIHELVPGTEVEYLHKTTDQRSYHVSFKKLENLLKLKNTKTLRDGIIEVRDKLKQNAFGDPNNAKYHNYRPWG